MTEDIDAYYVLDDNFRRLQQVEEALQSDSSPVTPDQRRDLANLLSLIVNDISQMPVGGLPAEHVFKELQAALVTARDYIARSTERGEAVFQAIDAVIGGGWPPAEVRDEIADAAIRDQPALVPDAWMDYGIWLDWTGKDANFVGNLASGGDMSGTYDLYAAAMRALKRKTASPPPNRSRPK